MSNLFMLSVAGRGYIRNYIHIIYIRMCVVVIMRKRTFHFLNCFIILNTFKRVKTWDRRYIKGRRYRETAMWNVEMRLVVVVLQNSLSTCPILSPFKPHASLVDNFIGTFPPFEFHSFFMFLAVRYDITF